MPASSPPSELRTYLSGVMARYQPDVDAGTGAPTFAARLAFQRLLHAGGWAAPGWPTGNGGRGLSIAEQLECDEVRAEFGAPVPAGVLGLANVGPALIEFGTPEQQRSLPRILDGTEIWCQGFSEPDAGSDLANLRTSAVDVGGRFVVNGQKIWTSNGMEATHCMLLVRTDPTASVHRGISVLLVPLDTNGIDRRPIRMISGESEFAELFFSDVRVPPSALLGPLNDGWRVTVRTLEHERAGVLSRAAALERLGRRAIVELAGQPELAADLRDRLARCYVEARVLGLLGRDTLGRETLGRDTLGKENRGVEIGSEQALIKLAWGVVDRLLAETIYDAVGLSALAGGRAGPQHALLFTRSSTIAAGTTEILKNVVADRVLKLPR
jgi:alkylation response protein AidB-like acyl-CoA dehydrogenase